MDFYSNYRTSAIFCGGPLVFGCYESSWRTSSHSLRRIWSVQSGLAELRGLWAYLGHTDRQTGRQVFFYCKDLHPSRENKLWTWLLYTITVFFVIINVCPHYMKRWKNSASSVIGLAVLASSDWFEPGNSTMKYLCDHIDAFYTWAIRKSSEYLTPVIWSILKSWYISGCQPLSHTITITDRRQQLVRWRSSLFSHISKTKASFGLLETERKTQPCVATCNWGGFEATEYQPLVCICLLYTSPSPRD